MMKDNFKNWSATIISNIYQNTYRKRSTEFTEKNRMNENCKKDACLENWSWSNSFHKWEVHIYQKSKWMFAVPKAEIKIVRRSKKIMKTNQSWQNGLIDIHRRICKWRMQWRWSSVRGQEDHRWPNKKIKIKQK